MLFETFSLCSPNVQNSGTLTFCFWEPCCFPQIFTTYSPGSQLFVKLLPNSLVDWSPRLQIITISKQSPCDHLMAFAQAPEEARDSNLANHRDHRMNNSAIIELCSSMRCKSDHNDPYERRTKISGSFHVAFSKRVLKLVSSSWTYPI